MISMPIGLIIFCLVIAHSAGTGSGAANLNTHSLVLVFGGTLGVLLTCTPLQELRMLVRAILDLGRGGRGGAIDRDLDILVRRRDSETRSGHPLFAYAQELWESGIDPDMIESLLTERTEQFNAASEIPIAAMRNVAKYPPAIGMIGTVIGLVSLFTNLTPESKASLGPLLAIAMTATFYGLVLSNGFLMPLADRLYVRQLAIVRENERVLRVLVLISRNEVPKIIEREMRHAAAG